MNNHHYFLYYFFDNPIIRWIRVLVFFIVGFVVYLNQANPFLIISLLPLYFLFILQELYIHFSLDLTLPEKTITAGYKHLIDCVDFSARACLERNQKIDNFIKKIINESEVKYFNKLLNFRLNPQISGISEDELLLRAKQVVENVDGKYIHGIDLYVSYLLLLEDKNKLLFDTGITKEDVLVVLSWVRKQYALDKKHKNTFHFSGSGVFDFFVYGWSAELSKYASNFTKTALVQNRTMPIGRNREYDLLITALSKNSSSNALIIGEAGIGKTALISQFVIDSNAGMLPKNISNKIVFKLDAQLLLAGINNEGDLEARVVSLFSELLHAGNIIVYIPNIENIFGGGGINIDISSALIEYLRSNRIKIIGSITEASYQTYIYPKHALKEFFDVIEVEEPDAQTALFMVLEKSKELEKYNNISIAYSAVKQSCTLSDSYMDDGTAMPGRAIRLIEDTISYCETHGIRNVTEKEVQHFVEEKTRIVLDKPNEEESSILLDLETAIHKRIVAQDEAVSAIANAMRRVRSGMKNEKKPIASFLFLGPTGVGKTETAKALAYSYFGDEKSMIRVDMSEYQTQDSIERLLGSREGAYEETVLDNVFNNPYTMILLDEFEKANARILDLFLQVFDEGRLTDNRGRTVSFKNTIIIATSNAGSEFIREEYKEGANNMSVKQQLIEKVLKSNIFKPELMNRFDDIVVFKPLSEKDIMEVAKLFLKEIIDRIGEQQISLNYDEQVPDYIAKSSYSIEFGARNIRRFIEQSIENQLSKLILSKELHKGSKATITVLDNALVIKS